AEGSGFARFAGSEVHQPTMIESVSVFLRVIRGNRVGTAAANKVDDEGLRELAVRAGEAAEASPEDPDLPALAGASQLPDVDGSDEETAALGPADQARLAADAIAGAGDMPIYGFFTSGTATVAVVTSAGFAGEQTSTDTLALALAATGGASGYAEQKIGRASCREGVEERGVGV